MLGVSGIVVQLIGDTLRWWRLTFRSTQSLKAENLFLRPQLALYVEHGMKPRAHCLLLSAGWGFELSKT